MDVQSCKSRVIRWVLLCALTPLVLSNGCSPKRIEREWVKVDETVAYEDVPCGRVTPQTAETRRSPSIAARLDFPRVLVSVSQRKTVATYGCEQHVVTPIEREKTTEYGSCPSGTAGYLLALALGIFALDQSNKGNDTGATVALGLGLLMAYGASNKGKDCDEASLVSASWGDTRQGMPSRGLVRAKEEGQAVETNVTDARPLPHASLKASSSAFNLRGIGKSGHSLRGFADSDGKAVIEITSIPSNWVYSVYSAEFRRKVEAHRFVEHFKSNAKDFLLELAEHSPASFPVERKAHRVHLATKGAELDLEVPGWEISDATILGVAAEFVDKRINTRISTADFVIRDYDTHIEVPQVRAWVESDVKTPRQLLSKYFDAPLVQRLLKKVDPYLAARHERLGNSSGQLGLDILLDGHYDIEFRHQDYYYKSKKFKFRKPNSEWLVEMSKTEKKVRVRLVD